MLCLPLTRCKEGLPGGRLWGAGLVGWALSARLRGGDPGGWAGQGRALPPGRRAAPLVGVRLSVPLPAPAARPLQWGPDPPRPLSPAGPVPRPWSATAAVSQGEPVRSEPSPLAHASWLGAQGCYCSSSPCPQVPHTPSWPFWGPGLCLPYLGVTRAESGSRLGLLWRQSGCSSSGGRVQGRGGGTQAAAPPPGVSKREKQFQAHRAFGDLRDGVTRARTYFCASEAKCDSHMETFLRCIEASGEARPAPASGTRGRARGGGWSAHPGFGPHLGGQGWEAVWAHTPSPARCFLRSLAGPRCPDADLLGDLDLVTRCLALPRAAPSQGLRLRPPGWRCCPAWPLGMTTPSRGELNRKTCRPRCASVSEAQWVPSSSPVRAPTLCEHSRDRSEDHPEAARWGQLRAPDWSHRQRLPGVQGSGRLRGSGLGTDERRCDHGLPVARREGRRRRSAVRLPPEL